MLVTGVIILIFFLFYVWISEDGMSSFLLQMVGGLCLAGLINLLEWIFGLSSTQAFFVVLIGVPIGLVIVMNYFDKENKN